MPRGHPDWQVNTGQFSFLDMDTAEAMVRIGSPNVYSRSGRVLYIDGFEDSLAPWTQGFALAGAAIARNTAQSFHGSACLKITPASVATFQSSAYKDFPYVVGQRHGVEEVVWGSLGTTRHSILLVVTHSPVLSRYALRLDYTTEKLSIWTLGDVWVDIDSGLGDMRSANPIWRWLKIVVDTETSAYVRAYFNNQVYDISNYRPVQEATVALEGINLALYATDLAGTQNPVYIDNLIYTIDEP